MLIRVRTGEELRLERGLRGQESLHWKWRKEKVQGDRIEEGHQEPVCVCVCDGGTEGGGGLLADFGESEEDQNGAMVSGGKRC